MLSSSTEEMQQTKGVLDVQCDLLETVLLLGKIFRVV